MTRSWLVAVPSTITLGGVFLAFLALVWAPAHPYWAGTAIIGSSLCDMIDGRVARLTHTESAFGVQLDSLADIISFGVAPAYLVYVWGVAPPDYADGFDWRLIIVVAFLSAGALRLARFNLEAGESHEVGWDIIGLSIPAAALLPTAVVMMAIELELTALRNEWVLMGILAANSLLMVSRIKFPSYKRFRSRWTQAAFYAAVAFGCSLLIFSGPAGTVLFALLALYVALGLGRALASA